MLSPTRRLVLIFFVTAISLYIALPSQVNLFGRQLYKRQLSANIADRTVDLTPELQFGLDLRGGVQLLLEADMSQIPLSDRQSALESAQEVILNRVDRLGIAEPVVQTSQSPQADQYRLIVELPGVSDVEEAVSLVGQTAALEFRVLDPNQEASPTAQLDLASAFVPTELTGANLKRAQVQFNPENGKPMVSLEFDDQGRDLFAEITGENIGQPVAIFLDDYPLTIPRVETQILDGQAVISGEFTSEDARALAIQLNAGALPTPINVVSQKTIDATLGQAAVDASLTAGLVGLTMVVVFMIGYYGVLGFLASLALGVYAVITLALYKLMGVTVTLPGLAGFILSVGMAVDANILIFERYREEIRLNKPWQQAIELGFGRAWDSIKDANVATLLICFILFNPFNLSFLNTAGLVKGFALTLAIGIVLSLFTGIIVTRTLIRSFYLGKTGGNQ